MKREIFRFPLTFIVGCIIFLIVVVLAAIPYAITVINGDLYGPEREIYRSGRMFVMQLPIEGEERQQQITIFNDDPHLLPYIATRGYAGLPQRGDVSRSIRLTEEEWRVFDNFRKQWCDTDPVNAGPLDKQSKYVIGLRCGDGNSIWGKRVTISSSSIPVELRELIMTIPPLP